MEFISKFKARKIVSQMIKRTKLNEAEAKVHFYQMVSASSTSRIKVTDLGFALASTSA